MASLEGHECGFGEVKVVHCSFCCRLATESESEQSILKRQFFGHGIFSSASLSAMLVWDHGYIHGEKWFALICRHDISKLKEAVLSTFRCSLPRAELRANIRDANDHVLPHPGLHTGDPRTEHIGPPSRRVRASSCSRMSGRYIGSTASAQRASHGHWVRLPRSALDSQTSSYDQAATRGSRWPVIARPLPSMGPARSDAALRRAWPGAGWISEIERPGWLQCWDGALELGLFRNMRDTFCIHHGAQLKVPAVQILSLAAYLFCVPGRYGFTSIRSLH